MWIMKYRICIIVFLFYYCGYLSSVVAVCLRVVGGIPTTIEQYPNTVAILMRGVASDPVHICGGAILNERHVLTAAHCFMVTSTFFVNPNLYISRVGSTLAHSGGVTHDTKRIFFHPDFDLRTVDNDVAIMRTASRITYGPTVQPATIPGKDYQLGDNESLWAVGWGVTAENGNVSEQLRHVQVLSINKDVCANRYRNNLKITDNMLCSGWLDVGGRDQCTRDSGSPVYHHKVVVGLSSLGLGCARPCFPGVNARVSRFTNWIQSTTKPQKAESPNSVRSKNPAILPTEIRFGFDAVFNFLNY